MIPLIEITGLSVAISFVVALAYRFTVDPNQIRKVKEELEFYKAKLKKAQKARDEAKVKQFTSDMLKTSQKQFKLSMKPLFASMGIFVITIFGLLGGLYGIILPLFNQPHGGIIANTNLILDTNTHKGFFTYRDSNHSLIVYNQTHENGNKFKIVIDFNDNGDFSDDEAYFQGNVINLKDSYWELHMVNLNQTHCTLAIKTPFAIPFFGNYLGWFWWFILIEIPVTMLFRKLLGAE